MPKLLNRIVSLFLVPCLLADPIRAKAVEVYRSQVHEIARGYDHDLFGTEALAPILTDSFSVTLRDSSRWKALRLTAAFFIAVIPGTIVSSSLFAQQPDKPASPSDGRRDVPVADSVLMFRHQIQPAISKSLHEPDAHSPDQMKIALISRAMIDARKGKLPYEVFIFFGNLDSIHALAMCFPLDYKRGPKGSFQRGIGLVWNERNDPAHASEDTIRKYGEHEIEHFPDLWPILDTTVSITDMILTKIPETLRNDPRLKDFLEAEIEKALTAQSELRAIGSTTNMGNPHNPEQAQYFLNIGIYQEAVARIVQRVQPGLATREQKKFHKWLNNLLTKRPAAKAIGRSSLLPVAAAKGPGRTADLTILQLLPPFPARIEQELHIFRRAA